MLGAALGAYEHFREWTKTRKAQDGSLGRRENFGTGAHGAGRRRS